MVAIDIKRFACGGRTQVTCPDIPIGGHYLPPFVQLHINETTASGALQAAMQNLKTTETTIAQTAAQAVSRSENLDYDPKVFDNVKPMPQRLGHGPVSHNWSREVATQTTLAATEAINSSETVQATAEALARGETLEHRHLIPFAHDKSSYSPRDQYSAPHEWLGSITTGTTFLVSSTIASGYSMSTTFASLSG